MLEQKDKWIEDQLGRLLEIGTLPERVISLVPSLTELLCGLGLEDRLVGVTKFCTSPKHLRAEKQVVGGTKQIHYNRVKTLAPDLVLCNKEENTPEMVEELSAICPVHVSDIKQLEDFYELLDQYGKMFGAEQRAGRLAEEIRQSRSLYMDRAEEPRLKAAYFIWKDPWMLVGGGTFIDAMLAEGGFDNVAGNTLRYPILENSWPEHWESPEVVFLSSEPFPFKEKHINELRGILPESRFELVDGTYFSWYGPRLKASFEYMYRLKRSLVN